MTPQEITTEAVCFDTCVPPEMQAALQTYLLNQLRELAGGDVLTVEELVEESKCFACIPAGQQSAVQTYLLDQILTASE